MDIQKTNPGFTKELFAKLWDTLSPQQQQTFQLLVNGVPSDANLLKTLLQMAKTQFRYTFGNKSKVVIVGPANVGKSTLYNQFIQNKLDLAKVSPIPGTTRTNQLTDAGCFTMVDTPGMDAVGSGSEEQLQQAYSAAAEADFLIILFDAIQGVKKTELELFQHLKTFGKPFIVVLNKIDLVAKEEKRILTEAAGVMGLNPEQIVPISAKNGKNISKILLAIAAAEPEITAALGQALPGYRKQLAWKTIISGASVSCVIALAPIPVIDFAPLVIIQSTMILGIARIYQFDLNFSRVKELIATFGIGLLGRTLFQQLSKFGGIPGWILSAAIAGSTTVVMGLAAIKWFESGEKISQETLKTLTEEFTKKFIQAFKALPGPRKESIKQIVTQTLEKPPEEIEQEYFE